MYSRTHQTHDWWKINKCQPWLWLGGRVSAMNFIVFVCSSLGSVRPSFLIVYISSRNLVKTFQQRSRPPDKSVVMLLDTYQRKIDRCGSSRKVPVLAHFTIHMVEIIQLYTDQPHTWLGFRHHPSSSVFQPYVWLDTISNSLNF